MDTGSARKGVTEALTRAARKGLRAIGGHPIAGNEGRGFASARTDLFQGASFALLPVHGVPVPPPARKLVRALGAKALVVDPKAHDRALARTSHLPYLVSKAIATSGDKAARRGLSGPGFRSMTRLAGADPRVALAYCRSNREEVARAWRELRRTLDRQVRGR
jgi:prephenate dehydrogenase